MTCYNITDEITALHLDCGSTMCYYMMWRIIRSCDSESGTKLARPSHYNVYRSTQFNVYFCSLYSIYMYFLCLNAYIAWALLCVYLLKGQNMKTVIMILPASAHPSLHFRWIYKTNHIIQTILQQYTWKIFHPLRLILPDNSSCRNR